MRPIFFNLLFILSFLFNTTVQAKPTPIAEVVKIRGEATELSPGSKMARNVVLGDKFIEDTSVLTGPKSFLKMRFIDGSEMNLGPESKIIISEMKQNSVGIISLLKGRIRTEVQKDANPTGNKFFVKTRTAAMGVRGTDFQTIYNPDNKMTSLLTYKGEVALAKVDEKTFEKIQNAAQKEVVRNEQTNSPEIKEIPAKRLDETEELNKILKSKTTVVVPSGQNAFSSDTLKKASLPVKISPLQLEALYKNQDFQEKAAANINQKGAGDEASKKGSLKSAAQVAPAEGFYNDKTGDFAPKSGGFIDLATGLYVAPDSEAKLDSLTGVYVSKKIGSIDADTGQYVAPKGLVLDAKKGFVLDGDSEKKPELLALREDMNRTIAKDLVIGSEVLKGNESFNINEKFIRDRVAVSLWGMGQNIKSNASQSNSPYLELDSSDALKLALEWSMASNNRFSPIVGLDYSILNYSGKMAKGVTQTSKKTLGLSLGAEYAMTKNINLYAKLGLHQNHYLNQSAVDAYNLEKIVLTRFSSGLNAEIWRQDRWGVDGKLEGLLTFRKRINNLIVHPGTGFSLGLFSKYRLGERKWLALGFSFEQQNQRVVSANFENRMERKSSGPELKYLADF
ncbi:MAG: FecR domain-containing protein [Bacteriovorax sp.]|nr:FecR domain-containing protein [Bacteriovorax sp.]